MEMSFVLAYESPAGVQYRRGQPRLEYVLVTFDPIYTTPYRYTRIDEPFYLVLECNS